MNLPELWDSTNLFGNKQTYFSGIITDFRGDNEANVRIERCPSGKYSFSTDTYNSGFIYFNPNEAIKNECGKLRIIALYPITYKEQDISILLYDLSNDYSSIDNSFGYKINESGLKGLNFPTSSEALKGCLFRLNTPELEKDSAWADLGNP